MRVLDQLSPDRGRGPLLAARPPVRVMVGGLLVAACVLAPRGLGLPALFIAATAAGALLAAGAPGRTGLRALQFGLLLYLPLALILLAPLVVSSRPGAGQVEAALVTAGTIAIKGTATLVITLSTAATLRAVELHSAAGALPLPRTARLLLIQIMHQTGILYEETVRVRQALSLRQARSRPADLRLLLGLPRVWLERIASRAQRTAAAMEVRGYAAWEAIPFPPPSDWTRADRLSLIAATGVLALGLGLHLLP